MYVENQTYSCLFLATSEDINKSMCTYKANPIKHGVSSLRVAYQPYSKYKLLLWLLLLLLILTDQHGLLSAIPYRLLFSRVKHENTCYTMPTRSWSGPVPVHRCARKAVADGSYSRRRGRKRIPQPIWSPTFYMLRSQTCWNTRKCLEGCFADGSALSSDVIRKAVISDERQVWEPLLPSHLPRTRTMSYILGALNKRGTHKSYILGTHK